MLLIKRAFATLLPALSLLLTVGTVAATAAPEATATCTTRWMDPR
jgi:hypothetical protein